MRLICPNCGAQYEVDEGVIPEGGRDVQCSNCGHTWFQRNARDAAAHAAETRAEAERAAPEQSAARDDATEAAGDAGASDDGGASAEPVEDASHDARPEDARPHDEQPDDARPDREPDREMPPQRSIDEGIKSILREEAEREAGERKAESASLETQPELGLAPAAAAALSERTANIGEASPPDDGEDVSRREILPDIEEINSTLAPAGAGNEDQDEAEAQDARSGFRRGFILAIVLFAVLTLVYVFAPLIGDAVPALAAPLKAYAGWVDGLRAGIDVMMMHAVEKLTALVNQLSGSANPG